MNCDECSMWDGITSACSPASSRLPSSDRIAQDGRTVNRQGPEVKRWNTGTRTGISSHGYTNTVSGTGRSGRAADLIPWPSSTKGSCTSWTTRSIGTTNGEARANSLPRACQTIRRKSRNARCRGRFAAPVEMGGVEPPSRISGRLCPTRVVGFLCAAANPCRPGFATVSRTVLDGRAPADLTVAPRLGDARFRSRRGEVRSDALPRGQ